MSLSVSVSVPELLDDLENLDTVFSEKNEFSFAIHSHGPFFSLTNKKQKPSDCPGPLGIHSLACTVPVSPLLPRRVSCSDPFL